MAAGLSKPFSDMVFEIKSKLFFMERESACLLLTSVDAGEMILDQVLVIISSGNMGCSIKAPAIGWIKDVYLTGTWILSQL